MNPESVISIILTIAFILIALAIKNKNKPVNKPDINTSVHPLKNEKLNDFEALLLKLEQRKKEQNQKSEAKDDIHSVEYEDVKSIEHHADSYDETKNEEKNNFDLKSAIIYNSILERKKF
jgi:hypothetical protein